MGGVYASADGLGTKANCWVRLYEHEKSVELWTPDARTAAMTPEQARALARQLYRLARRVEARQTVAEKEPTE